MVDKCKKVGGSMGQRDENEKKISKNKSYEYYRTGAMYSF